MRHPWPLLALAVVMACNDDGQPATSAPTGTRFTIHDPRGDTLAWGQGKGEAHDALGLQTAYRGDTLVFTVRFAELVQPVSTRASNAVLGIIDFDVDDDPATGVTAIADDFGGTAKIGAEWSLFLEDSLAGPMARRVALVDLVTNEVHWIPGTFDGSSVTAMIPRSLLGIRDARMIRLSGAVGTMDRVTDIFPNEGAIELQLPAP